MATPQTEIESKVTELATESLEAFCEDISGMFGVDMQCEQQDIVAETIAKLKKRFKKLVAVNVVDSEGILTGTFQLIFDQEGLFTLGGVMVMLPEKRILANRKSASADLAESMVDAVGEAGNLLVGSWERIFREELEGHGHFLQKLPAFVGKPWDNPKEKIGLSGDEELLFIPYEMTIAPYPAFKCGVIFPKTIFESKPASDSEDAAGAEEDAPETEAAEKVESEEPQAAPQESAGEKSEPEETVTDKAPPTETEAPGDVEQTQSPEAVEDKADSEESGDKPESEQPDAPVEQVDDSPEAETAEDAAEEETATADKSEEPAMGPVSEAIREMAQSPSVLPSVPGEPKLTKSPALDHTSELLWICAKDIMQDQVVWASPDDTVEQVLAKMQQHDAGYAVVGQNGTLEGIVSKSDAAGAMSPYLRPMFAKWRRPSDDATLKIKIKWIMSRPVRTAKP
ncbi:MAG: CBS domain-containing protein, partial [Planctomycetota bacterium]|nr:CBS domain-containing protein [Planctomycetota bacterium]